MFTFQAESVFVGPGAIFLANHIIWTNPIIEHCTHDVDGNVDKVNDTCFRRDEHACIAVLRVRTNDPCGGERERDNNMNFNAPLKPPPACFLTFDMFKFSYLIMLPRRSRSAY